MMHPFAMTLTKPHEAMGFQAPIGRRLSVGLTAWNLGFLFLTVLLSIGYVVRVNATAVAGYRIREVERRVDTLHSETMAMQDKLAALSSLQELATKAGGNGYVQVDRLEFVSMGGRSVSKR